MIFDLLNISNNAYDHAFQRYVKPQNPEVLKLVEGTWRKYSPNRRYSDETPAQRGLIKRFKMGLPMDPRSKAAAMRLIAKGAPHWHDPDKSWAIEDKAPRNPAAKIQRCGNPQGNRCQQNGSDQKSVNGNAVIALEKIQYPVYKGKAGNKKQHPDNQGNYQISLMQMKNINPEGIGNQSPEKT